VNRVAVYTTIYPGVQEYLQDWFRSLVAQTDQDFQLWIGLDGIEPEAVERVISKHLKAIWVRGHDGETPAQIRQQALTRIVEACDAVVLVDSDDVLRESRVAAARAASEKSDLAGCALRLVDLNGKVLGLTFTLPPESSAEDVLPKNNVFGFSNSTYRSELLRRCLPVPPGVVLVDWFLATKAWLMGAELAFDPVVRMDYRQHGTNMARVRYPVSVEQVVKDTDLVRRHFQLIMGVHSRNFLPERKSRIKAAACEVERFHDCIIQRPTQLEGYVKALNILNPAPLWWSSVAHPALESMWREAAEFSYERC